MPVPGGEITTSEILTPQPEVVETSIIEEELENDLSELS